MGFNFNRYKKYTEREEVYLFTLRDYCERMIKLFDGCMLNRDDMPMKGGYLMKFGAETVDDVFRFVRSDAETVEDYGSLVRGTKVFLKEAISKDYVGDGTAKSFQIASNLVPSLDGLVLEVGGVAQALTLDASKSKATFTGGEIVFATGLVTFATAPADKTAIHAEGYRVKFYVNYQMAGDTCFVGLGTPDDVAEVAVSGTLPADGEKVTFETVKNLEANTVAISFKLTAEGASLGASDDGKGVLRKVEGETTTVYGNVDYITGVITMNTAPVSMSYTATRFDI